MKIHVELYNQNYNLKLIFFIFESNFKLKLFSFGYVLAVIGIILYIEL